MKNVTNIVIGRQSERGEREGGIFGISGGWKTWKLEAGVGDVLKEKLERLLPANKNQTFVSGTR